jgi:hypothetical protein
MGGRQSRKTVAHGAIGEQIFAEVERLTAGAKMNRLAAFNDIAKRSGRAAGTVAANYYRIARKRGAPLRARRGRAPGRPSGEGVIAAVAVAIRRLEALLLEQAQELAALRKDNKRFEKLRRLLNH